MPHPLMSGRRRDNNVTIKSSHDGRLAVLLSQGDQSPGAWVQIAYPITTTTCALAYPERLLRAREHELPRTH